MAAALTIITIKVSCEQTSTVRFKWFKASIYPHRKEWLQRIPFASLYFYYLLLQLPSRTSLAAACGNWMSAKWRSWSIVDLYVVTTPKIDATNRAGFWPSIYSGSRYFQSKKLSTVVPRSHFRSGELSTNHKTQQVKFKDKLHPISHAIKGVSGDDY